MCVGVQRLFIQTRTGGMCTPGWKYSKTNNILLPEWEDAGKGTFLIIADGVDVQCSLLVVDS